MKEGKAKEGFSDTNSPVVTLEMKDPKKFGQVTTEISSKPAPDNVLVIWLDFEEGVDSYKEEMLKPDPKLFQLRAFNIRSIHPMWKFQGHLLWRKRRT